MALPAMKYGSRPELRQLQCTIFSVEHRKCEVQALSTLLPNRENCPCSASLLMGRISFFLLMTSCVLFTSNHSFAQRQADDTASATTGGTTEGLGGLTTEGIAAGNTGSDTGGTPGANAVQEFIGGANTEGFVGGARESTTNSAVDRFFREIVGGEVPTGGTQESSSGSPRRVPVTLRLGFNAPAPRAAVAMAGVSGISLQRFFSARPDLQGISVSMDDAGMATLVGPVSESSTRRLASNLIRMQPGVKRIRNLIEVVETGSTVN
jgi:hypothetical protein